MNTDPKDAREKRLGHMSVSDFLDAVRSIFPNATSIPSKAPASAPTLALTKKRKEWLQRASINRRWAKERDEPVARSPSNNHEFEQNARFILVDRDGDFVMAVDSGNTATIKYCFTFTNYVRRARVFSYRDLYKTSDLGFEFARGYSGARAIRIDSYEDPKNQIHSKILASARH
jgi:hypothetical protein